MAESLPVVLFKFATWLSRCKSSHRLVFPPAKPDSEEECACVTVTWSGMYLSCYDIHVRRLCRMMYLCIGSAQVPTKSGEQW